MVDHEATDRVRWQSRVVRAGKILTAALAIYAGGVVVLMGVIVATGGGVSCNDADCVPLARFANDVAPWGMISWIAVSLVVATILVRQRTDRKSHRGHSGSAGARR